MPNINSQRNCCYIPESSRLVSQHKIVIESQTQKPTEVLPSVRKIQPKLGQSVSHDLKGQNILTKFIRYESQIERSLFKAMHEFERMQALSLGKETSVPVAVDVDIDVA